VLRIARHSEVSEKKISATDCYHFFDYKQTLLFGEERKKILSRI